MNCRIRFLTWLYLVALIAALCAAFGGPKLGAILGILACVASVVGIACGIIDVEHDD
jgi:hypothetical protein